ncbi:hypothetical protein A0H81_11850 [Grifola frondosa]|uniref:BAG domain-containing protein n=1 Tax=Grifola frondosa TaxID=5627 RepID=A0A1C7LTB0_GRIFR|nr:hypothetical protein A0H81_11850 [Grifola frondosa]
MYRTDVGFFVPLLHTHFDLHHGTIIPIAIALAFVHSYRLHFSLPPSDTKLSVIRQEIAEYTQLPEHSFKLIHAGAVMKDDNAPISAYGIKPNSTIALVGGGEALAPAPSAKAEKAPRNEENTISQIRGELDKVRHTLQPDVDVFLTTLSPSAPASHPAHSSSMVHAPKSSQARVDSEQEHARLGELLLQSLLRLDAITAEGEWEEARRERKGAVREVQALLDRLDGGWRARARS